MEIQKCKISRCLHNEKNRYSIRNSKGELLAVIWTPNTQEEIFDSKILSVIAKALSLRWNRTQSKLSNHSN